MGLRHITTQTSWFLTPTRPTTLQPILDIIEQAISAQKVAIRADTSSPEMREHMNNRNEARDRGIVLGVYRTTLIWFSKHWNITIPAGKCAQWNRFMQTYILRCSRWWSNRRIMTDHETQNILCCWNTFRRNWLYDRVNDCRACANGCPGMLLHASSSLKMLMNMIIMKMSVIRALDYSIGANDNDDHANESLFFANEWPITRYLIGPPKG